MKICLETPFFDQKWSKITNLLVNKDLFFPLTELQNYWGMYILLHQSIVYALFSPMAGKKLKSDTILQRTRLFIYLVIMIIALGFCLQLVIRDRP